MFDHEKLDVYRVAVEFAVWAHEIGKQIPRSERNIRDQWNRASVSIPLNIAEGNGKRSSADRKRFLEISRGSSLECASILDLLLQIRFVSPQESMHGKELLHREVSMLTKMIRGKEAVRMGE
jgi:four helix bundle protein